MVCRTSGYVEVIPMPDKNMETAAYAFYTGLICRYGPAKPVTHDRGREWVTKMMARVKKNFGFHIIKSRPNRPQGNGKAERWIRTFKSKFSLMLQDKVNLDPEWDCLPLHTTLFACRSTVTQLHNQIPIRVLIGGRPWASGHLAEEVSEEGDEGDGGDEGNGRNSYVISKINSVVDAKWNEMLGEGAYRQELLCDMMTLIFSPFLGLEKEQYRLY